MKKVIISDCFGRYKWSNKGIVEVIRRKGINARYVFWKYIHDDDDSLSLVPMTEDEFADYDGNGISWAIDEDGNDVIEDNLRTDTDAIAVLEQFGSKYCSDPGAHLIVEEYDDEIYDYEIKEDNGNEWLRLLPSIPLKKAESLSKEELIALLRKLHVIREEW